MHVARLHARNRNRIGAFFQGNSTWRGDYLRAAFRRERAGRPGDAGRVNGNNLSRPLDDRGTRRQSEANRHR